jgi:hypothetical protein
MRRSVSTAALLILLSSVPAIRASSLAPPCVAENLATYDRAFGSGASCSVGILNFNGFSFDTGGTNPTLGAGNIEVTPAANGVLGGGFTFSAISPGLFAAGPGQSADYFIDYGFVIDPGPISSGADLGMDPVLGDVMISQTFSLDTSDPPPLGAGSPCPPNQNTPPEFVCVDNTNPPASLTGMVSFNPPAQNFGFIQTSIDINNSLGLTPSSFDSVTATLIVATPEPVTWMLTLAGLLCFGVQRKLKIR